MQAYKLLNQNMTSFGGYPWRLGRREDITATGEPKLCSRTVFHAYASDLLAGLMNPVHANIELEQRG